jgi:hypothetical protein
MARISKRELEQIVKRDLPGYKLLSRGGEADAAGSAAAPDEVSPDIDALRRKYLGDEAAPDAAGDAPDRGEDAAPNTDDEIISVQPDKPGDPFDQGARPKKVVVSGKSKRIIGSQG